MQRKGTRTKPTRSNPTRVRRRVFACIVPSHPGRIRIIWRHIRKVEWDLDDWERMGRKRHLPKVTRRDLEVTGRIPNLSVDMIECKRNYIACRIDLNLGKCGEGKVGWGT